MSTTITVTSHEKKLLMRALTVWRRHLKGEPVAFTSQDPVELLKLRSKLNQSSSDAILALSPQEDSQPEEIDPTEQCPYCGSDDVNDDWIAPMYLEDDALDFYCCGECNNRWEVSR